MKKRRKNMIDEKEMTLQEVLQVYKDTLKTVGSTLEVLLKEVKELKADNEELKKRVAKLKT
jgi:uncharacterized protein YoxC